MRVGTLTVRLSADTSDLERELARLAELDWFALSIDLYEAKARANCYQFIDAEYERARRDLWRKHPPPALIWVGSEELPIVARDVQIR